MYSTRSSFYFNGDRDYIHGPTLTEMFRNIAIEFRGKGPAEVKVRRINIRQRITNDDAIRVFDAEQIAGRKQGADALAEMLCEIDGEKYFVGLYTDQPEKVFERRESIEKTFVGETQLNSPFEGYGELQNIRSHYDLFQAVVEINKQLHLKTVTAVDSKRFVKFKFVSCRDFVFPKSIDGPDGEVRIENIGMGDMEDYRHTLSKVTLEFDSQKYDFTIGFASQDILDLNFV